jgi:Cytochrome P460
LAPGDPQYADVAAKLAALPVVGASRAGQYPVVNSKEEVMRRIAWVAAAVTALAGGAAYMEAASGQSNGEAAPIYGIKIPDAYRDWRLISVKRLTGKQLTGDGGTLRQLRAELGNDLAIQAYRDGTRPFPDGAIIAALHWNEDSSDTDNQALAAGFPGLGLASSFAGSAMNVQFTVKDSKKYAASGGWGFADFTNGKPGNEALHAKCFSCHQPAKDRDYVFTHYAPTP